MIALRHSHRRGFGMIYLIGLVAISVTMCFALLATSVETYHGAAMGQWRLQARAAAEGAVVSIEDDPSAERGIEKIGDNWVFFEPAATTGEAIVTPYRVEVRGHSGRRTRLTVRYRAHFRRGEGGAIEFERLETVR